MTRRRVRLLVLALVAIVLGAALARAALGPRYGGELTIGVLELPAPGEPEAPRGFGARLVAGLAHETLVAVGGDGTILPRLAEGWAAGAAGREWTLALEASVRFQDGAPVTSADVLRSLRRFVRARGAAASRFALTLEGGPAFRARGTEELPGLAAPDPSHVVVRTSGPAALPLAPLASPAAAITSPGGAGCGPFVPTLSLPERRLVFTAFPGHVRGRPYLDGLELVGLPEPGAAAGAAGADGSAGRYDLVPGAGGPSAVAATLLLVLDSSRPPFDRAASRKAAATAIDRVDLVRNLLPGADPAPSLLVPALLPPLGRAPVAGRATASGSFVLAVARDVPPLVSQRVVAHLTDVGFRVQVVPTSPSAIFGVSAAARLTLFEPEVAEAGLALEEIAALAPPVAEARDALDAAARETGLDARRRLLHRAEGALRDEGVLVPLASVPVAVAGRPGLHGARVDLCGRLVLEDAWLEP
jgi:ABC-type oligopeptide transport system substrate-binding subunit